MCEILESRPVPAGIADSSGGKRKKARPKTRPKTTTFAAKNVLGSNGAKSRQSFRRDFRYSPRRGCQAIARPPRTYLRRSLTFGRRRVGGCFWCPTGCHAFASWTWPAARRAAWRWRPRRKPAPRVTDDPRRARYPSPRGARGQTTWWTVRRRLEGAKSASVGGGERWFAQIFQQ